MQINPKHKLELSSLFRELSSPAKFKVREKTTQRQFVKNKVRKTLSDLGYLTSLLKKLTSHHSYYFQSSFFTLRALFPLLHI